MGVLHIVLFQFVDTAKPDEIKKLCALILAFPSVFLHSKTKEPYILSVRGGKDVSTEGFQGGFTHGFVFEFKNIEDRDDYVKSPSNLVDVDDMDPLVKASVVVDLQDGKV